MKSTKKSCQLGWLALLAGAASLQSLGQAVIPADAALPATAADTGKPGFTWRVHQTAAGYATSISRAESQLSGLLGANVADPSASGAATGPAQNPSPITSPIAFDISTVINVDQAGGSSGNFQPDEQMPGIPGTGGSTDNIAAEVLTWIELPEGLTTMGVNSDDGFRVLIGGAVPTDAFAVKVGEFDGGRGAADSIFQIRTSKAGLYAARLLYFEGGGDARLEWFTQKADGTKVLINDTANGGLRAFRAVTSSASKAYVSKASPAIGQTGVAPNAPVEVQLTDGQSAIDPTKVKLSLNGTQVSATATKANGVTTVKYTPTAFYPAASSQTAVLSYEEGGATKEISWNFRVYNYPVLTGDLRVTPDTSKGGFVWRVFANSAATATSNARAEAAVGGSLRDGNGELLPNLADPSARGVAIANAPAANPANAVLRFEIDGVLNLAQNAADDSENKNGNFTPDQQMPGVPATDGSTDGLAAEILTYLDLPAGVITMGVNSDDGFKTTAGIPRDVFGARLAGEFDAGRGASDSIFYLVVEQAGVYAFRTLWSEGGGGANIEWFTLKADGTKVLVNDRANGGVAAYRATTSPEPSVIQSVSPLPVPRQLNAPSPTLVVTLADGSNPVDDASVVLKVNGQTVNPNKQRSGSTFTLTYFPTSLFVPDQRFSAEVTFKSVGGTPRTQQWNSYNLKNIVLPAAAITEKFDSYAEGGHPTGWVEQNFTTTGTAGDDLDDLNSDSYKGWIVVSAERLLGLKGRIFNWVEGSQIVNGQPLANLADGNMLYAESDVRGGNQVQFITSKPFNLSAITNPVVSFSSLYEQNQDSLGAVEYSVDGGNSWLPVVDYLDFVDGGGDIKLLPDGSVDAVTTFKAPNPDTAAWTDNGVAKGDIYGDGILAPITQALGIYIAPRWNDNQTEGKRFEVFRLPMASKKSDVRLRFAQLGTGSWYFGIDNLSFYEGPAPAVSEPAKFNAPTLSGDSMVLSWTGTGVLEESTSLTGPWSTSASQANPQNVPATGDGKFFRLR